MESIIFFFLQIFLIGIDLLISLLTFGWISVIKKQTAPKPIYTVPVGDDPSHRVLPKHKDDLATVPSNGATTVSDIAH